MFGPGKKKLSSFFRKLVSELKNILSFKPVLVVHDASLKTQIRICSSLAGEFPASIHQKRITAIEQWARLTGRRIVSTSGTLKMYDMHSEILRTSFRIEEPDSHNKHYFSKRTFYVKSYFDKSWVNTFKPFKALGCEKEKYWYDSDEGSRVLRWAEIESMFSVSRERW